jgi:hypothetical protein
MTAGSNKGIFGPSERKDLRYAILVIYIQEQKLLFGRRVCADFIFEGIQYVGLWGAYDRRGESLFVKCIICHLQDP